MSEWRCPVCDGGRSRAIWRVDSDSTENGVDPALFRPSADRYGETVGTVLRCLDCGHGSLEQTPTDAALAAAYGDAADPASIAEEPGQVETGRRALVRVESVVRPGQFVDLGCWTGSLVAAAKARGWQAIGIEPSRWAVERAAERGLDVRLGDLRSTGLGSGVARCVALCDVIEHVLDVSDAIRAAADLLEPGGALLLTMPDAGGRLARLMGARWWSVLPMHVQYFTRESMALLLQRQGLRVVEMRSHPKVFTAMYYAGRLGGYSPALARGSAGLVQRTGFAGRLVAPDFRDRMLVIAVK